MDYQAFSYKVDGSVAHITLNQGARGNPIDELFCAEWKHLAIACSENSAIRAVLIDAQGKNFSVGG